MQIPMWGLFQPFSIWSIQWYRIHWKELLHRICILKFDMLFTAGAVTSINFVVTLYKMFCCRVVICIFINLLWEGNPFKFFCCRLAICVFLLKLEMRLTVCMGSKMQLNKMFFSWQFTWYVLPIFLLNDLWSSTS